MTILASARDLEAFCSPSAAITCTHKQELCQDSEAAIGLTLALASLAASASAAIARCNCTGSLASLLTISRAVRLYLASLAVFMSPCHFVTM